MNTRQSGVRGPPRRSRPPGSSLGLVSSAAVTVAEIDPRGNVFLVVDGGDDSVVAARA